MSPENSDKPEGTDSNPNSSETEIRAANGDDGTPTQSLGNTDHLEIAPSVQVGPYRLLRKLGAGGMGEVWEAQQDAPVRRRVALKIIKRGMDSEQVIARFEAERQALAMMDHEAIAKIFDAGTTPHGRPFFAMELVKGTAAVDFCDRHRLTNRERLELFVRICEGVQHAHQKGIIHRDLKPSNVLITATDETAQPKIIDFGLAKAIEHRLTERTMYTELGAIVGTPDYMSPEQAEMSGLDVDTRTDVYSLGVMLYQLLVGALPFDPEELRQEGYDSLRRRIREEDPLRPSSRLDKMGPAVDQSASNRRTDRGHLHKQLEGDLDWITMKAMDKDRRRRYQSPSDLAADIRRHLHDEPVLAMPPSTAYILTKFARRHTAGVITSAALFVILVAFAGIMTIQAGRIASERDRANQEAGTARRVAGFLAGIFKVSDPGEALGNTITARELLDKGAGEVREDLADEPLIQAQMMGIMGEVYTNLGLYREAAPLLTDTVTIRRDQLGGEHPDTLQSMHDLGILLYKQGLYDQARTIFSETLDSRRRVLGDQNQATLDSMNSMANLLFRQRQLDEAEALYTEALPAQRRILGDDHPDTLKSMNNLAALYRTTKRLEEAAPLAQEAWASRKRVLGEDHPDTISSLRNLSAVAFARGELEQAEPLFIAVLDSWRRTLGETHPNVLTQQNNLASLYRSMGRLQEGEAIARATVDAQILKLGTDHPSTFVYMDTLANIKHDMGRTADALDLYRQILAGRTRSLGAGKAKTLETLDKIINLLSDEGDTQRARVLTEDALKQIPMEDSAARELYEERLARLSSTSG